MMMFTDHLCIIGKVSLPIFVYSCLSFFLLLIYRSCFYIIDVSPLVKVKSGGVTRSVISDSL